MGSEKRESRDQKVERENSVKLITESTKENIIG